MVKISLLSYFVPLWVAVTAVSGSKAFYGLNYGVDIKACPSLETVQNDFRTISQYTDIVRIYSVKNCNLGELALQASQASNLQLYLGMWVDKTNSFDQEFSDLQRIAAANSFHNVEAVIVGSEVMYRNDSTSSKLVKRIEKVKGLVHPLGTKVTTSEVYYKFSPDLVDAVDFLMMNAFIYWEGKTVDKGADILLEHYDHVKSLSKGKTVRISETGFPDQGEAFSTSSIPSPENQRVFLLSTLCKTRQRGIETIWFSAIDENYKSGVEAHFGLLDSNRQLKSHHQFDRLMNPC